MADNFGDNFITINDDEGKEYTFEHLDTVMMNENYYLVCLPTDISETDPNYGIVILRQEEDETGDLYLAIPEDDEEEKVYDEYMHRLYDEWEDEDGED